MPSAADIAGADPVIDETLYERRMRALTLRIAGGTFAQIAHQLKVSPATARKDVEAAKREIVAESAEGMIAEELAALRAVRHANMKAAVSGDIDAGRLVLATSTEIRKLFGLDAPSRVSVGVNDIEFAERTAALIESLGLEPPRELVKNLHREDANVVDAEVVPDSGAESAEPNPDPDSVFAAREPDAEPGGDAAGGEKKIEPKNSKKRPSPERADDPAAQPDVPAGDRDDGDGDDGGAVGDGDLGDGDLGDGAHEPRSATLPGWSNI